MEDKSINKNERRVDTLLENLSFLSKYYQRNNSKESLVDGLSIFDDVMNVNNFIKASKKIGLISKFVSRTEVKEISKYALPAVVFTNKYESMVLLDYDYNGIISYRIIFN